MAVGVFGAAGVVPLLHSVTERVLRVVEEQDAARHPRAAEKRGIQKAHAEPDLRRGVGCGSADGRGTAERDTGAAQIGFGDVEARVRGEPPRVAFGVGVRSKAHRDVVDDDGVALDDVDDEHDATAHAAFAQ